MAEENVRYNVEINEQDLAQQLERIRNQIDLTMGSMAFGSDQIPLGANLTAPLSGGIYAAPDVSSNGGGIAGGLPTGFLDESAQNLRLGYSKFTEDMRTIGLLSSPQYPSIGATTALNPTTPDGFFSGMAGAIG